MSVLGQILVQFVFRLTFGMALAMAVTPSKFVTSGYYRVHLWVLMGLNTLAALAVYSGRQRQSLLMHWQGQLIFAVLCAAMSYVGAVWWLYERHRGGKFILWSVSLVGLVASILSTHELKMVSPSAATIASLDSVSSGLLMGTILAAMLLGHWYLNTPTMQLLPLERLVGLVLAAAVLRAAVCTMGLAMQIDTFFAGSRAVMSLSFLAFRWLAGILGPLVLSQMARQTLKIPNTQSATGILYAAVILVFLGELTSQLLSVDATFPV